MIPADVPLIDRLCVIFEAENVPSPFSLSIPYDAAHLNTLAVAAVSICLLRLDSMIPLTQEKRVRVRYLSEFTNRPSPFGLIGNDLEQVKIDASLCHCKRDMLRLRVSPVNQPKLEHLVRHGKVVELCLAPTPNQRPTVVQRYITLSLQLGLEVDS